MEGFANNHIFKVNDLVQYNASATLPTQYSQARYQCMRVTTAERNFIWFVVESPGNRFDGAKWTMNCDQFHMLSPWANTNAQAVRLLRQ